MKSSWVWMMVQVVSGCNLIKDQPQTDVRELSGVWYPLAVAWTHPLAKPVTEYKIVPTDEKTFVLILPVDGNGKCNEMRYGVTAEREGFKIAGGKNKIRFVESDINTYHIAAIGEGPKMVFILYAKGKNLSNEMKGRFLIRAPKWGFKRNHIVFNPKTSPCRLSHC